MAQIGYSLTFEGSQEVPARSTAAFGTGFATFDTDTNTMSYVWQVNGLDFGPVRGQPAATATTLDDVTGFHFHNNTRGVNGPIVFDIPTQDTDDLQIVNTGGNTWMISGSWEVSDPASTSITQFAAALAAGTVGTDVALYGNIHTTQFGGGEIRGQLVGFRPPPHRDFNADANADVLWQNDNGTVHVWQMDGNAVTAAVDIGVADPTWHVRGTGDLTADGMSDIVWQNDNGTVRLWQMNGTSVAATTDIGTADASWHIRATGDFNGDSDAGILWQNDNGTVHVWETTGNAVTSAADVGFADSTWHVRGVGDFGGDGRDDILWQNDNGAVNIWQLGGSTPTVLTSGDAGIADATWNIRGAGDFNGDGKDDILWQDGNGFVHIWQMNGGTVSAAANVGFAPAGWHIRDIGDYGGDGMEDILWQHDNGTVNIWHLNGSNVIGFGAVGSADQTWAIIPPDNTGSTDILTPAFGFDDLSAGASGGTEAAPASDSGGSSPLLASVLMSDYLQN